MAHHANDHSAHDHHHDAPHDHHGHHHGPKGTVKSDTAKVGGLLLVLFLVSMAAHYVFAEEMLYDWSQNRQNAQAAQDIQPNAGQDH